MLRSSDILWRRTALAGLGALAGLAAWALIDPLPRGIDSDRAIMVLSVIAGLGFGGILTMTGPLTILRAAAGALPMAGVMAALMLWASHRFADATAFLETGHPIVCLIVVTTVFWPFWIAIARHDVFWRDYETLFDEAWRIVVRGIVAGLFVGAFWAVIFLGDGLLRTVDITWISDALEVAVVPYVLTGLVFGLGLAVVHEFGATISPYLPLRLLRLMLPPAAAVMALFVAVVPFRGLSDLFASLSVGGILIASASLAIALVSIAVDRTDEFAVAPGVLRISARILSALAAVLGGLAVWAVVMRAGQHGWTPDRLAALTAASTVFVYGVVYAVVAGPGPGHWMERLRSANVWLALGVALVAVLWLTPVINPQRLSAADQLERFVDGEVSVEALDLWSIRAEFGRPGEDLLQGLATLPHSGAGLLNERLSALAQAPDRFVFEEGVPPAMRETLIAELVSILPVLPDGAEMPAPILREFGTSDFRRLIAACARDTEAGNPGCLALVLDFDPETAGTEAVTLSLGGSGYIQVEGFGADGHPRAMAGDVGAFSAPGAIDRLVAEGLTSAPVRLNAVTLGGRALFILP